MCGREQYARLKSTSKINAKVPLVLQPPTQGVRGQEQYERLKSTSKNNVKMTLGVTSAQHVDVYETADSSKFRPSGASVQRM